MVRKNAINKYKLPVPKDLLQRIDRTSSPAHMDKLRNAIDFIVDKETPVLAADDGIVTFVNEELNESATMFAMTAFWSNVLDTQNYGYNTFINELKKMGEYMTKTKNK